ncbi:hypothetical protein BsWGS_02987 [Bradybaena similaris]
MAGPVDIKGFLVRARQNGNFVDGMFQGTESASRCNGQALTHTSSTPKSTVNLQWTAPASLGPGPVQFVATIVQLKTLFWTEVTSADISVVPGSSGGGSTNAISPAAGSGISQITPGPTGSKNGGNDMQNPGAVVVDPECSKTKGCYHDCHAGEPCTYSISWEYEKEALDFQFLYKMPSKSDKWIALALSHDALMGDDSVMECVMENGNVLVKTSYNKGKFNEYPDDKTAGLSDYQGSVKDGVLACRFRRKIQYPVEPRVFDLSQNYYIMVATGEAVSGNKFPHSYEQLPKVSTQKVSLLQIGNIVHGSEHAYPWIQAHGSLMIIAWMFFASSGLLTARHGKKMFLNTKPFGLHVWYHIHRMFMGTTTLLTLTAFIVILIEAKGYSYIPDVPGKTYRLIHPPLGLVVVVLAMVNPLMALFRPDLKSPSRKVFNWGHWGCGMLAWLLSLLLMVIGLDLNKSGADVEAIFVLFAFVGYQLVIDIVLRVVPCAMRARRDPAPDNCCKSKSSYNINMAENPANETSSNTGNSVTPTKEKVPKEDEKMESQENVATNILMVLHLVVCAGFTIAVLYFFLRRMKHVSRG